MGIILSALSVIDDERVCKFCYGDDDQEDKWLRPCRCSGSLQWVHFKCFDQWLKKAPAHQQVQCQTCRHVYEKSWMLKPITQWCRPPIRLSAWECLEILLDAYSTFKFFRGFSWTLSGKRSFWVQCLHFLFWRTFIATNRRIAYYGSLGRQIMSSIFEISIKNFEPEPKFAWSDLPLAVFLSIGNGLAYVVRDTAPVTEYHHYYYGMTSHIVPGCGCVQNML
uniref:RING-CH-type domain-containing protein n=1 Tax=Heterorhabditis bacteriophora TaxID=37862 RepID=A0A1I7X399_HETBA